MARLPQPGGDNGNWGDILNEFLAQSLKSDGTIKDNAVTANNIAPNSITSSKIATDAISAAQIADGSITETLLASDVQTKLNSTSVGGGTSSAVPPAISLFRNLLALRHTRPAIIVCCGSSTTQGLNASDAAHRYTNRLAYYLQQAKPMTSGASPATVTSIPGSPGNGVQVVNLGLAGAYSSDYITISAGARQASAIGALDPVMVIHQVPLNDYTVHTSPDTTKANILARVDAIDAAASRPVPQLFLFTFPRWDITPGPTTTMEHYKTKIQEIADLSPDTRAVLDLNDEFAALGIGYGSSQDDWAEYMSYDVSVHMGNDGHEMLGSRVAEYLIGMIGGGTASSGDTTAPTAATSVNFGTLGSTTAQLTWTAGSDNVGVAYQDVEYRSPAGTGSWLISNTSPLAAGVTSHTIGSGSSGASLIASTTIEARVVTYDAAGNSTASAADSDTLASGGGSPSPFEIALSASNKSTNDIVSVNITVPSGVTNAKLVIFGMTSHAGWLTSTNYDSLTCVSSIDGSLTARTPVGISHPQGADIGPSGQKQGSVHAWVLDNPSAGAHTLTMDYTDASVASTGSVISAILVTGCSSISLPTRTEVSTSSATNLTYNSTSAGHIVLMGHGSSGLQTAFNKTTVISDGQSNSGLGDYLLVGSAVAAGTSVNFTTTNVNVHSALIFDLSPA